MARLSCSKRLELCDLDAWNKITFSDETRMQLPSNKQEFIRWSTSKRNDPRHTTKTVKIGVRV